MKEKEAGPCLAILGGSKQPRNKVCLITTSLSRKVGYRCCLQPVVRTEANPAFPAHSISSLLAVRGTLPSELQGNVFSFQM